VRSAELQISNCQLGVQSTFRLTLWWHTFLCQSSGWNECHKHATRPHLNGVSSVHREL